MKTEKKTSPYQDVTIELRRMDDGEWQLCGLDAGKVVSLTSFYADEKTALTRAETLAGWLGADLVVHKIGLGE